MNKMEYKNLSAFHPGYYVAEVIDDMGITQDEFATRMGSTGKTISKLVNGQCNLSNDLAQKLASMLGTSVDVWLNLQTEYDKMMLEIEKQKALDSQIKIVSMIDYNYFVKVAKLAGTRKANEKVFNLCAYLQIADLGVLCKSDFLVNFRTGAPSFTTKNMVNSRAWIQTAMNIAKDIKVGPFNPAGLKKALPEIRSMSLQRPKVFLPRLRQIFVENGIAFVLLPYLKNSGINGAVKWYGKNKDRVLLAMNDRNCYADTFWFSLFHEIRHVLQQKPNIVFVSSVDKQIGEIDAELEKDANSFAQDYLVPPEKLKRFAPNHFTSDADIKRFAESIKIHPGIVAGRLKNDKVIAQNRCSKMREQYKIIIQD